MVNLLLILFIILNYIKTEAIINKIEFSDNINILNFQLYKHFNHYFLADISKFSNEDFFSIPIDYEIKNNKDVIFKFEYVMITETENIQINNIKYLNQLTYNLLENFNNINNIIKYHIIYKNNNQKKIIFKIKIEELNDNNNNLVDEINIYIKKFIKITKINSDFNKFISEDDYKNNNKFYFINNFELKENFQYLIFTDSILGLNIIKESLKQNENINKKIIYLINNQTDNNKLEIIKNENNENDFILRIIIEITEPLINLYIKFFNYLFINNEENDYILNYFIFNNEIKTSRRRIFWRRFLQPLKIYYYLDEYKKNLTENKLLFFNNRILNIYGFSKNEQFTSKDLLLKYFPFSLNQKKYFNDKIINLIFSKGPSLFFDLSFYNYYPLNNLTEQLKENSVYYLINQNNQLNFNFIKNLAFNGNEVPFSFTALYNEIYENSFNVEIKINNKIITLYRNKPSTRFIEKIDNNSKLFIDIFNLKVLQIKIGIINNTDVNKIVVNKNIKKTYSNSNTLIFQINDKKFNHFLTVFNPNLDSNFNIEFTSYPFVSSYIKNKKFFREDDINNNINFIRIPIKDNKIRTRYFKNDKLFISTTNCKGKCYYKFEKIKNIKVNFDRDYKFIDNNVYEFEFPIFLNTVDVNIEIYYDNNNNNLNNIFEYNLYLNNKIIKMGLINTDDYKTLLNLKFSPFNKYFLYIFDLTKGIIIFKKQNALTIFERNNDIYYTGRLKDKFEMIDFNKILFTYYPLFKNVKTEYIFIFMKNKYDYILTYENMIKLLDDNNFENNEKFDYYVMRFNDFGLYNKMEREINIYVNESGRYKFNYIKKNSLTGYENIDYENEFRFNFGSIKGFSKLLLLTIIICLLLITYVIYKIITIKNKIFGKKDYSDMELTALL